MASPRELVALARAHEARAADAIRVRDETAAVLWLALAAEVAVDVLARAMGTDPRRDHHRRATLARRAFERGLVSDDLGSLLIRLHTERQRAAHHGVGPDLRGRTTEDAARGVAVLVAAAERAAQALDPAGR